MDDSPRVLFRVWGDYAPTPLGMLPQLAERGGVATVYLKDESWRPLGSFKFLGGAYAGLRALARASGAASIESLVANKGSNDKLPTLICASDGNHGLAVAAAAEMAGSSARVYLHSHVPAARAKRIADRGAVIVWIDGTYDDSVDAALAAANRGEGILVSDTSADADDPGVADVLAGYGLMADEIVEQLRLQKWEPPTHLFVQAGVGGLAAALARGLRETHGLACRIVVVEPERAACVGAALRAGRIERLPGDLHTAAEMLSCGEASASALKILQRVGADAIAVGESELMESVDALQACNGPTTTPSGATGLAGLLSIAHDATLREQLAIDQGSRVLLIATEEVVS